MESLCILSLKAVLILTKSSNLDKMHHYDAFYLGLHCLQKYSLWGFLNLKG